MKAEKNRISCRNLSIGFRMYGKLNNTQRRKFLQQHNKWRHLDFALLSCPSFGLLIVFFYSMENDCTQFTRDDIVDSRRVKVFGIRLHASGG